MDKVIKVEISSTAPKNLKVGHKEVVELMGRKDDFSIVAAKVNNDLKNWDV